MRKIIDLTKKYTEDELEEFMCDLEASMEKEQGRFLKKLEGKSPKEILDAFAEQYMIQADFLFEVSEGDVLSAEEIAPLLASAHPLQDLYKYYRRQNGDMSEHMFRISDALRNFHGNAETLTSVVAKKYYMIVTEEDANYDSGKHGLSYFADAPWKGVIVGVFEGDTADELFAHGENEGLFYQLFASETGDRIGYGVIDPDSLNEDIERFEVEKLASKKKD